MMTSSRTLGSLLALTTLGCLAALPASAQTVYSTYPVTGTSGGPYQISGDGGDQGEHEIAMQFSLPATSLVNTATLALYYDNTITSAGPPFAGGPITVTLYDDSAGTPNNALTTGTIGAIATDGSIDDYSVMFTTPVTLSGGNEYWIGADGGVGTSTTVFWALGTGTTNIADRFDGAFHTSFTQSTGTDAAFSIGFGVADTPEPGSLAMIGAFGMVGVGLLGRRRVMRGRQTASGIR